MISIGYQHHMVIEQHGHSLLIYKFAAYFPSSDTKSRFGAMLQSNE